VIVDATPATWAELRRYLRGERHRDPRAKMGTRWTPRLLNLLRELERDLPSDRELESGKDSAQWALP
jgi:hypothetical protein